MGPDGLPPKTGPKKIKSGALSTTPTKSDPNTITVKDMVERIHTKIDDFADGVDEEFLKESDAQLKAKKRDKGYFITNNYYWDLWLQKLFAQMISVKIWIIALISVLLKLALITSVEFASILGIIMALKGTFAVAEVWKKNGKGNGDDDIIDKV